MCSRLKSEWANLLPVQHPPQISLSLNNVNFVLGVAFCDNMWSGVVEEVAAQYESFQSRDTESVLH